MTQPLPRHEASIYLTPLREGGSLPAVVEVQDGSHWVVKFRGAGQGPRALIAEVIVAGLARALDLPVPQLAVVTLDESFGQGERDPEIRDIFKGSRGVNVGLRYLDGAFNLDPVAVPEALDRAFATRLVWLDALVTNPDRSARNPNLMLWRDRVWLIDHGAALYFHHDWSRVTAERLRRPFPQVADHILLTRAGDLDEADPALASRITPSVLREAVDAVPGELLEAAEETEARPLSPAECRERYRRALEARLEEPRAFAAEAERLRLEALRSTPSRLEARR